MNYSLTNNYFKVEKKPGNEFSVGLILFGLLIIIIFGIGVIFGNMGGYVIDIGIAIVFGVGIAAVVAGAVLKSVQSENFKKEKASIPSDVQYDGEVDKMLRDIKLKAMEALGLDEDEVSEVEPLRFHGYDFQNGSAYKVKKGMDGVWRSNRYTYTIFFFSENEVHCYTCRFCTTEDKKFETTDIYFYQDIVSASTSSESTNIDGHDIDHNDFKLTTAGGTALCVSLRDVDGAQRSINAMRSLLRAKKQSS